MGKQPQNPPERRIVACPIDDVSVYLSTPEEVALKTAIWDLMYGKDLPKKPQSKKTGTKRAAKEEIAGGGKRRRDTTTTTPPPGKRMMSSKVNYEALERLVGGGKGEADGDGDGGKCRSVPEEDEEEEEEEEEGVGGEGRDGSAGDGIYDGDYFETVDEGDYDDYYDD